MPKQKLLIIKTYELDMPRLLIFKVVDLCDFCYAVLINNNGQLALIMRNGAYIDIKNKSRNEFAQEIENTLKTHYNIECELDFFGFFGFMDFCCCTPENIYDKIEKQNQN